MPLSWRERGLLISRSKPHAELARETVWDEGLSGQADGVIAARTREEGRILVTLDFDFANIGSYPPHEHPGIIVLRRKRQDKATVAAYMRRVVAAVARRSPEGELRIVESDRIRHRG